MTEKIEKMLIDQMNFEMYSAYVYMAMAACLDSLDLTGFSHWMKIQTQEEMYHSIKLYNFIVERGGRPVWDVIQKPRAEYETVKEIFIEALAHEKVVTSRINMIMDAAIEESDHATRSFLNWYVDEQVEEEASADAILKKLAMVEGAMHGVYMLDKELGARVFTVPADFVL
ncbi:MAG: ferritin [Spirochaetota bacterium]